MSVCTDACNLPCEKISLTVTMAPQVFYGKPYYSAQLNDTNFSILFTATNVSNTTITSPIVVSSSLAGTVLLTTNGLNPGATVQTSALVPITAINLVYDNMTDQSFAAIGLRAGVDNLFFVASRLSPVVKTVFPLKAVDPNVTISASITADINENVTLNLRLDVIKPINALRILVQKDIFPSCQNVSWILETPDLKVSDRGANFTIDSNVNPLTPGTYGIIFTGTGNCSSQPMSGYNLSYTYVGDQGLVEGIAAIPGIASSGTIPKFDYLSMVKNLVNKDSIPK